MLDIEQKDAHEVWGIQVPRHANGKYQWPAAIKSKAVERIKGGETIVSIAIEIGANQSLVAKWAADDRDTSARAEGSLSFVEVVASHDPPLAALPVSAPAMASCDIFLGDVRLAITSDFPAAHLTEILRAVRESQ